MNRRAVRSANYGVVVATIAMVYAAFLFWQNVPLSRYLQQGGYQSTPLGSTAAAESTAGVLYLVPVALFTFFAVCTARRRLGILIPVTVFGVMFLTSCLIVWLTYWWMSYGLATLMVLLLAVPFILSLSDKAKPYLAAPFQIWLGTGVAMLLTLVLPSYTVAAFAIAAALWDVYAVFRGPLKKLATDSLPRPPVPRLSVAQARPRESLFWRAQLVNFGGGAIGLGDVVFYSALVMIAAEVSTAVAVASVYAALSLGIWITVYKLRSGTRTAWPGLPLPVLFAFIALGLNLLV